MLISAMILIRSRPIVNLADENITNTDDILIVMQKTILFLRTASSCGLDSLLLLALSQIPKVMVPGSNISVV